MIILQSSTIFMFPRWTIQNLLPPASYLLPSSTFLLPHLRQKKRPSQSHSLRRAEYQLAVPLKLRPRTPLFGFVFQTPCAYAASRKTITPSRVQEQERFPALGSAPVSPLRLGRDGRLGIARRRFSAAPALWMRPFPAVFVIAFAMKLRQVYHRFARLSSAICEKQRKNINKSPANCLRPPGA